MLQAFKILKARTGLGSPLLTKLYQQLNYSNFPEFLHQLKNSDKLNLFYLKDKLWHKMDQEYVNKCVHTLINNQVEFNHQNYKYNLQQLVQTNKRTGFCRSILIKFDSAKIIPKVLYEGKLGIRIQKEPNILMNDKLNSFVNQLERATFKLIPDDKILVEQFSEYGFSTFRYFKIESTLLEMQRLFIKEKLKYGNKTVKNYRGLHLTCKDGITGILEKLRFNVRMVNRNGYIGSNGKIVSKLYGQGVYFTPLAHAYETLEFYGQTALDDWAIGFIVEIYTHKEGIVQIDRNSNRECLPPNKHIGVDDMNNPYRYVIFQSELDHIIPTHLFCFRIPKTK